MQFCDKCKSIMKPEKRDNKTILKCDCGFEKQTEEKVLKEKGTDPKPIEVVHNTINPLAVCKHKCKKCGFDKAELISKGIWYSDEGECHEYVCGKCGFHERVEGNDVK